MVGPGGSLRSESEVMSLERPEDPLYIVEAPAWESLAQNRH